MHWTQCSQHLEAIRKHAALTAVDDRRNVIDDGAETSAPPGGERRRRAGRERAGLARQLGAPDALDEAVLRRATPAPRVRSARTRLAVRSIGDAR